MSLLRTNLEAYLVPVDTDRCRLQSLNKDAQALHRTLSTVSQRTDLPHEVVNALSQLYTTTQQRRNSLRQTLHDKNRQNRNLMTTIKTLDKLDLF